ncbi:hypothetical protein D7U34_05810 [Salmonella enterica]|nr:hypothetical protein [Salmonella enterica]ECE0111216.1 hypothetical protein [Salmonella enterica subsp. diarizonae]ECU8749018.1 hypothetical protein [Salmonella enterica subsp. diarizonae str. CFSAN000558]RLR19783.1 hypothetical protein C6H72_12300 [Salmonella enterica subsp. diarizonae serovar 48:i:z]EAU3167292.1 hypothetical protein [Salmonella enterica]
MRTPDRGSTTGAASWTDDKPARRLPAGRAQRVNPPLTAILKKELVRKYGLFFRILPHHCRMAAQASYPAYREHSAIRHEYYYPA